MPLVEPDGDPLVGQTLAGRYQIERKLGEGGMGSVYLGHHVALEKRVALKVLHGEFVRKPDLVERFLQEAKAASKIRHDNVIDITDFGQTEDGLVFFAMELLDGRDLAEELGHARLDDTPLPWARTRHIFLQICAALSAAHDKGIIHRDLKPENIYLIERLGQQDFVKLLDFGIAKLTEVSDDGRKLTKTGMLFGTPEYMSPEQARGEKVDHRVDVYAMGCILYQMVTGHVPFEADNFMGILTLHLTQETPRMGAALTVTGAPPALEDIVQKALAKEKEQRHESISAMVAEILALDDGLGDALDPIPRPGSHTDSAALVAPSGPARTQWTGSVKLHADPGETAAVQAIPGGGPGKWIAVAVVAALGLGGGIFALTRGGGDSPEVAAAEQTPEPGVAGAGQTSDNATTPPDAPREVTVAVTSQPGGAQIVNAEGEVVGTTGQPFQVAQSDAPVIYTLRLDGYEDRKFTIIPDRNLAEDFVLKKERRRRGDRKRDRDDDKVDDSKADDAKAVADKVDDSKADDAKAVADKVDDKQTNDGAATTDVKRDAKKPGGGLKSFEDAVKQGNKKPGADL